MAELNPIYVDPELGAFLKRMLKAVGNLSETALLLKPLVADVVHCLREERISGGGEFQQLWRRYFAKAACATIEAYAFRLKQSALADAELFRIELTPEEEANLTEAKARLTEIGEIIIEAHYIAAHLNITFAVHILSRIHSFSERFISQKDRQSFFTLFRVRDRLTHPKDVQFLTVSDNEWTQIQNTFETFIKLTEVLFTRLHDSFQSSSSKIVRFSTTFEFEYGIVAINFDGMVFGFETVTCLDNFLANVDESQFVTFQVTSSGLHSPELTGENRSSGNEQDFIE